ncbi:LPXTG cell wall anchor domain-containing protein [Nocardioides sp. W3-2-3]|uniref:LPXTG cell wall anchor domain-containing protein n=1 Tax=Nocardioides convexus TaxID=2712224 RepID=UPI002418514C|nr:LPXTG cell wall anchor domain-containing protein [Nocardioides convexus]NHA01911.1 LPXTG cell wall anchor domain-containing protein [Nocardioides convexus]
METKAPKGYVLPTGTAAEHAVEVTTANAGSTLTIAVTNERDGTIGGIVEDDPKGGSSGGSSGTASGVLPNTGAPAYAVPLVGFAALLVLLGGWLMAGERRRRRA